MRVSENIKFHISNEEKDAFPNSTPEELIDAMAKFPGRFGEMRCSIISPLTRLTG